MATNGINLNPNWRYASRPVKALIFDYRLLYFVLFMLFSFAMWKFYLFLAVAIFLYIVEKKYEYKLNAVFLRVSCFLAGKFKPAIAARRRNRSDR